MALGKPNNPGHWQCPIKDGQEVGDCSFIDVQANRVELKLPQIIAKVLTLGGSKAQELITVVEELEWILTTLRQRANFTDTKIDIMDRKKSRVVFFELNR
jgi:hypothetical protein